LADGSEHGSRNRPKCVFGQNSDGKKRHLQKTPARQMFYREIELFFGDLPHWNGAAHTITSKRPFSSLICLNVPSRSSFFGDVGARCRCPAADLLDDDVEPWLPATREDALLGRQTLLRGRSDTITTCDEHYFSRKLDGNIFQLKPFGDA
jgi:hypothetical protein